VGPLLVLQAHAQDGAPTQAQMQQMIATSDFTKTLLQGALPAGVTATPATMFGYVNDRHQWYCTIDMKGTSTKASATQTDPTSPERACVQAVLELARQHAI
jgi:hypothetical protein